MAVVAALFILFVPVAPCPKLEFEVKQVDSDKWESTDPHKGRTLDFIAMMHKRGCDYCGGSGRVSLFTKWFYPGKLAYWI